MESGSMGLGVFLELGKPAGGGRGRLELRVED